MTIPNPTPSIESLIDFLIQRIEHTSSYIHEKAPSSDTLHRGGETDYILKNLQVLKKSLRLLSLKGKEECLAILNLLNDRVSSIKELLEKKESNPEEIIEFFDIGNKYSDFQELDGVDGRKFIMLEYDSTRTLSLDEIEEVLSQIKYFYSELDITPYLKKQYQKASELEKTYISEKLITLRNEAIKEINPQQKAYIKTLALEFNILTSSIGLNEKLEKIEENIQITNEIKINHSQESIRKIETGYKNEAQKLVDQIQNLKDIIEGIFYIIIAVIIIKVMLLYAVEPKIFFKAPDILLSISFIVAFSAFLTFLIKERDRLIKLHDHYNFCDLELNSIVSYMNELNQQQRQETLIKLSDNYFRGTNRTSLIENNNSKEYADITKSISDLTKMINEFKGTSLK